MLPPPAKRAFTLVEPQRSVVPATAGIHFRQAFSLVELSIVLVILGLLVGGVLAGKSLIRSAEIKKGMRDIESYTSAVHTFKDKYFALPGDITNATAFGFGPNNNATDNGNGDGQITSGGWMFDSGSWPNQRENLNFWYHLQSSKLVATSTKGYVAVEPDSVDGYMPRIAFGNKCYIAAHSIYVSRLSMTGQKWNNAFAIAYTYPYPDHSNGEYAPCIGAEDVTLLDTKYDDGSPRTGKMMGLVGYSGPVLITEPGVGNPATSYAALANSSGQVHFAFASGW